LVSNLEYVNIEQPSGKKKSSTFISIKNNFTFLLNFKKKNVKFLKPIDFLEQEKYTPKVPIF
jgi:hypothetical protein